MSSSYVNLSIPTDSYQSPEPNNQEQPSEELKEVTPARLTEEKIRETLDKIINPIDPHITAILRGKLREIPQPLTINIVKKELQTILKSYESKEKMDQPRLLAGNIAGCLSITAGVSMILAAFSCCCLPTSSSVAALTGSICCGGSGAVGAGVEMIIASSSGYDQTKLIDMLAEVEHLEHRRRHQMALDETRRLSVCTQTMYASPQDVAGMPAAPQVRESKGLEISLTR